MEYCFLSEVFRRAQNHNEPHSLVVCPVEVEYGEVCCRDEVRGGGFVCSPVMELYLSATCDLGALCLRRGMPVGLVPALTLFLTSQAFESPIARAQ